MNNGFWKNLSASAQGSGGPAEASSVGGKKPARHASQPRLTSPGTGGQVAGVADRPIMALAPMANVTDFVFRELIAENSKPDVFFTEFVSVDGLCSKGLDKLLVDLKFSENQRPIVAQIFGSKPENFTKVAKLLVELGFDGIDINMGCPDRGVERQGAGAALIKNPKLAQEIILATKEGAGELPVSVKTRLGYNKIEVEEWIPVLAQAGLAAITIHLRTRKEMSLVSAHWELMPEIIKLIKQRASLQASAILQRCPLSYPLILGNGDVMTMQDAEEKVKESGCDGVMLGRGIFGNPWLFRS